MSRLDGAIGDGARSAMIDSTNEAARVEAASDLL